MPKQNLLRIDAYKTLFKEWQKNWMKSFAQTGITDTNVLTCPNLNKKG